MYGGGDVGRKNSTDRPLALRFSGLAVVLSLDQNYEIKTKNERSSCNPNKCEKIEFETRELSTLAEAIDYKKFFFI